MFFRLWKGREKGGERNTNCLCPAHAPTGDWIIVYVCALTSNWTHDPLAFLKNYFIVVQVQPFSFHADTQHTHQGWRLPFLSLLLHWCFSNLWFLNISNKMSVWFCLYLVCLRFAGFFNPWVGVFHMFWKILLHYLFKYFFWPVSVSCLLLQLQLVFFKSSPKNSFILFLERDEGRERYIDVRKKHGLVVSCMCQHWVLGGCFT